MTMPNREQFKNLARSTLSAAMDDSQTTLTVNDGSRFSDSGNFRLICESETMLCTGRSGDTLTVVRGQEGSTAAAHADVSTVSEILTAAGLKALFQQHDGLFGYSGRAVFGIHADNGQDDLTSSDFTWQGQGGATVTDRGRTILMRCPTDSAFNLRVQERNAPATPYTYTAAMRGLALLDSSSAPSFGIGFRESSSGKLMLVRAQRSSAGKGLRVLVTRCHDESTYFTDPVGPLTVLESGDYIWFKIEDDGTSTKFYVSDDGVEWLEIYAENRGSFMAGGPDKVVWVAVNSSNSQTELLVELAQWGRGE